MGDILLTICFLGVMLGVSFIDCGWWATILALVSFVGLGIAAHIKNKE